MKNIFKTLIAAVLITGGFASCEDEQELKYVTPAASFQILTPLTGESVVLNPENQTNPALVLAWEDMDYGTPTEVTYTVQVAANGTDFETPVNVTSTTNTYASIDVATLNAATDNAGLAPFTESGLDVRIRATVGTNADQERFSNVIVYLVTPFSTALPKLAVVGNHQGWNPGAADVPLLLSSAYGATDYEGFVWLDGSYKFLKPDASGAFAWGNTDYGDNGTFTGILAETGETDATATAGYYKVTANTGTLVYSAVRTNWGLIGSATAAITGGDGWGSDIDMTYDAASRTWKLNNVTLGAGAIKFRANDDWGINMGGSDGTLTQGGADINVAAGTYNITLDLSNPRAYTYTVQAI
ncbi:SusE domain-containing protein [Flavobacterium sp.]|uniref:SusE domain-containing protein n=1 Tax=Flavobacterium sp. TaxID=239 RepID=UPI0040339EA2